MKYDIVIIGGGIVGLASAYQINKERPNLTIAIVEKENDVAMHQTGHNSGVIHSGLYYKPGSLKALNCIKGYELLIDFCNSNDIKYDLCGKLVVAITDSEIPELEKLHQRGIENGLLKNKIISKEQIKEYEPNLNGVKAIHVPYTGIIDYKDVCKKMLEILVNNGVEVFFNNRVVKIEKNNEGIIIQTSQQEVEANYYINCAGLFSDKIASLTNPKLDTRIIPFRGEYYLLKPEKRNLINNLIYPVPDPNFPFLGVHFTRMIDGGVEAGPNAVFSFKREGYKKTDFSLNDTLDSIAWPGFRKVAQKYWRTGLGEFYRSYSKKAFTKALKRLIPEINESDLIPAEAGVRAQACDRFGGLIDDFKIIEDENSLQVLNAPSPAATSSLAIGKTLAKIVLTKLK